MRSAPNGCTKERTSTEGHQQALTVGIGDVGSQCLPVARGHHRPDLRIEHSRLEERLRGFRNAFDQRSAPSPRQRVAHRTACNLFTCSAGGLLHRPRQRACGEAGHDRVEHCVGDRTAENLAFDRRVRHVVVVLDSRIVEAGDVHRETDASCASGRPRSNGRSPSTGGFQPEPGRTATRQNCDKRRAALDRSVDDLLIQRAVLVDELATQLLIRCLAKRALGEPTHCRSNLCGTGKFRKAPEAADDRLTYLAHAKPEEFPGTAALRQGVEIVCERGVRDRHTARRRRDRWNRLVHHRSDVAALEQSTASVELVRGRVVVLLVGVYLRRSELRERAHGRATDGLALYSKVRC